MAAAASSTSEMLTKAATSFVSAKAGDLVGKIGDRASGNGSSKKENEENGDSGDGGDESKGVIGHTMENIAEGGGTVGSAVKGVGSAIKDKVSNLFKGSGSSKRPNNIVEDLFVGVPPEQAFAAWTDYEEWASFSKGIENVNVKRGDETETDDEDVEEESDWTAKVFLSRRSWHSTTTDFDPPNRIAWQSEGAKGTIDGTVTFTPVGDNATMILVVMEYRNKGPVEWIANRWRAAERRAKLDIKHFRRYVMRADPEELPEPEEPTDEEQPEEPTDETGEAGESGESTGDDGGDEATDDAADDAVDDTEDTDEPEDAEEPESVSARRPQRPQRRARG